MEAAISRSATDTRRDRGRPPASDTVRLWPSPPGSSRGTNRTRFARAFLFRSDPAGDQATTNARKFENEWREKTAPIFSRHIRLLTEQPDIRQQQHCDPCDLLDLCDFCDLLDPPDLLDPLDPDPAAPDPPATASRTVPSSSIIPAGLSGSWARSASLKAERNTGSLHARTMSVTVIRVLLR